MWSSELNAVRRGLVLSLLAAAWAPTTALAQEVLVDVVRSEPAGAQADVLAGLQRALSDAGVRLRVVTAQSPAGPGAELPALVISLGAASFQDVAARAAQPGSPWRQVPVLAALLGQATYRSRAADLPRGSSALWLDQPVDRFLELVRLALPRQPRVGVLLGPTSAALEPALDRAAAARGLTLVKATVANPASDLYPALQSVLQGCDILLALPDAALYNPQSLQNILIAAYRQRVPMLSYAPSHVRAGATLALHSPWEDSSARLVVAVRAFLAGRGLPAPGGVPGFAIAVNTQVAHSLSLSLPSTGELEAGLQRAESRDAS